MLGDSNTEVKPELREPGRIPLKVDPKLSMALDIAQHRFGLSEEAEDVLVNGEHPFHDEIFALAEYLISRRWQRQ